MTHLGDILTEIFSGEDHGFAASIAKRCGLSPSTMSKLSSGRMTHLHPKHVLKIADAITDDPYERAEIIAAHMKDESCGYSPGMIEIKIRSGNPSGKPKSK